MNKLITDFSEYFLVLTEDESLSLYSDYYQEGFHSTAGARSETLYNYIEGCQLERFTSNATRPLNILEVGFGLGLGLLITLDFLKENQFQSKLTFISVEIDPGLINYFIKSHLKSYLFLKDLERKSLYGLDYFFYEDPYLLLIILIGDATKTLKMAHKNLLQIKYHAIFQDAFSPKKNPELWSNEWFVQLKNFSDNNVILSTYSAAGAVRKALVSSGFKVRTRKGFGKKKQSLMATLEDL